MVVFDSTFLLLALRPNVSVPADPKTGQAITQPRERVEYLISRLSEARTAVLIPTPALAEALVLAGAKAPDLVTALRSVPALRIVDFDALAAIECAQLTDAALRGGNKRGAAAQEPYQKVKIDRQIVAIARAHAARTIYTTDKGLRALATAERLDALHVADLPLPPIAAQDDMFSAGANVAP